MAKRKRSDDDSDSSEDAGGQAFTKDFSAEVALLLRTPELVPKIAKVAAQIWVKAFFRCDFRGGAESKEGQGAQKTQKGKEGEH